MGIRKKQISKELFYNNVIYNMLKFLSDMGIKRFSEIKNIKNPEIDRVYSANTIALKLRYLENNKFIERKMFKDSKRCYVGYIITEKGLKLLKFYEYVDSELKKFFN